MSGLNTAQLPFLTEPPGLSTVDINLAKQLGNFGKIIADLSPT